MITRQIRDCLSPQFFLIQERRWWGWKTVSFTVIDQENNQEGGRS